MNYWLKAHTPRQGCSNRVRSGEANYEERYGCFPFVKRVGVIAERFMTDSPAYWNRNLARFRTKYRLMSQLPKEVQRVVIGSLLYIYMVGEELRATYRPLATGLF